MENEIDTLITDFTCDDVIKCQKARRKLVNMGTGAVEPLIKEISSKKHWVRWEAVKALSQIGDSAATGALIDALKDKEFDVRWLAAEGLITIGKSAVKPLLRELIERGESLWLREGAHHVLHDMDKGNWNEILQPVMKALEDAMPSIEVPQVAKKALDTLEK